MKNACHHLDIRNSVKFLLPLILLRTRYEFSIIGFFAFLLK